MNAETISASHGELHVDQPAVPLDQPQRQRPDDRQRVGDADQEEERIDRKRARAGDLHERRAEPSSSVLMTTRMAMSQSELAPKVALRHRHS